MRQICVLFLLVVTLCVYGCGGGGGGGNGSGNPFFSRYQSLLNDAEDEDLDDTMSNYSFDFFHDCTDYDDVEDSWADLFDDPGVSVDYSELDITFWDIQGDEGYAEGTFHVRTDDNGTITHDDPEFAMYFRREDGEWLLYGDQLCVSPNAPKPAKLSIAQLLGVRKG
jgi:hypothetical protein